MDGHRARSRDAPVAAVLALLEYLQRGQLANVVSDWLLELQQALLVEHHDRHRGHGLGHRGDAYERVGPHRLAPGDVAQTVFSELYDVAAAADDGDDSGSYTPIDDAVHVGLEPLQTWCSESHRFGRGERRRGGINDRRTHSAEHCEQRER